VFERLGGLEVKNWEDVVELGVGGWGDIDGIE
jgi:hypothetical protein